MTELAHAFWTLGTGVGECRSEALPSPKAGEVLVKTLYSGVSRGTETLIFKGQVPTSEYQRMRAPFQSGNFPGPVKYGYANVGLVIAGETDWLGQTVFCLYPHQSHYVVPTSALTRVPTAVPATRAILAANTETALNALWDAPPRVGDRISIVGGGVVGLLLTRLCAQIPGTEVELVDINPERAALAAQFGARFANPEQAQPERDLVFHVSGAPAGLVTALEIAGQEARVVEMSWFGAQEVSLPLGGSFHSRRLQLISSQVGTVSLQQQPRRNYAQRMAQALALLEDQHLDALINAQCTLAELPQQMAALSQQPSSVLCLRVQYSKP